MIQALKNAFWKNNSSLMVQITTTCTQAVVSISIPWKYSQCEYFLVYYLYDFPKHIFLSISSAQTQILVLKVVLCHVPYTGFLWESWPEAKIKKKFISAIIFECFRILKARENMLYLNCQQHSFWFLHRISVIYGVYKLHDIIQGKAFPWEAPKIR